ncbi:hypothetical protein CUT44_15990 [Streptomyces carminius]|uniref:CR-type domain-containing protein n=1 Tax=Streptomyces carminius TaxID=2665496 RepID=A0A2M8LXW6_9ACTN|nr:hypothetical protein [Streptomyces carminius]PJE96817.1 hypothetical protein CUT44_15990 [Streptomyces carminius]
MAEGMTEEQALRAVERRIAERGGPKDLRELGEPDLTRYSVFTCEVVHWTVDYGEEKGSWDMKQGRRPDLSPFPRYRTPEELKARALAPPSEPVREERVLLLRDGTEKEWHCPDTDRCVNGRLGCPQCKGSGRFPCEPRQKCRCRDTRRCTACKGSGKRRSPAPAQPVPSEKDGTGPRVICEKCEETVQRVTCKKCETPDTACPDCAGGGSKDCEHCGGKGWYHCSTCRGGGTVECGACGGKGHWMTWTQGVIEITSQKGKPPRQRRSLPPVVRWKAARRGAPWRFPMRHGGRPPEGYESVHRAEVERLAVEKRANQVAMEAEIEDLPVIGAAFPGLPGRVFYAFPAHSGIEVVPLPARQRVIRAAALTLCAAVLCVLVVLLLV